MKDRIIKSGRAVKGEDFVVAAGTLETPVPAAPARSHASAAPGPEAGCLLPSEQALNEAERIRAEAEQMASEIANEAVANAERRREETEGELQQLMETTLSELETQRETIERETRLHLEKEYRERYLGAVKALESAAAELQARRADYLAGIEAPALNLVLALARHLLGTELSRSPRFIAQMISAAFKLLKPDSVAQVALHPAAFHLLCEDAVLAQALRDAGIKPELIELSIDETLPPAAFCLSFNGMCIDYDLDEVLTELSTHLEERAATARSENEH